jgi:ribosomal protein L18
MCKSSQRQRTTVYEKQKWQMVNNSTNINKTNNHFSSQIIKKKTGLGLTGTLL